jgi:AcrR family transcriptional regulator
MAARGRGSASRRSGARRERGRVRSTARGRVSRERILDAAVAVVANEGLRSTTLDSVCRRAGVPKTSVYWHFGSKDGLLAALVERVAGEWTDAIERQAYAAGPDPFERLDRAFDAMRAILLEKPHLLRLLLTLTFEPVRVSASTRAALRRASARAESAITQGIEDTLGGSLPGLDLVANLILAMLQAASVRMLIDPRAFDADRHFEDLRKLVVLAIGHRIQEHLSAAPK